jgi:DNA/RNA-binding domain of Phe-tRNA-synthetase-like protein
MFLSELENRILTSGHDMDTIQGELTYDLAQDSEEYVKLNGEKQALVKNDVVLRDDDGVLASILFGPAKRTSITGNTVNPLYFAWCPIGVTTETVNQHLETILKHMAIVYTDIKSEKLVLP